MKKLLITGIAGLILFAFATPIFAADKSKDEGKDVTITGEAKCAKCALKESDKCQTVIQSQGKDGKQVTYYLVGNEVAKGFHKNVCSEPKKVTATGKVHTANGKMELAAKKIELAK